MQQRGQFIPKVSYILQGGGENRFPPALPEKASLAGLSKILLKLVFGSQFHERGIEAKLHIPFVAKNLAVRKSNADHIRAGRGIAEQTMFKKEVADRIHGPGQLLTLAEVDGFLGTEKTFWYCAAAYRSQPGRCRRLCPWLPVRPYR